MLLGLGAASSASAGFIGDTVSANYYYPDGATILYGSGNMVVGPGGALFDNLGGLGVGSSPSVDITDTNILITYPVGWSFSSNGQSFDGFIISNLTPSGAAITGVSLAATNIPGYDGGGLTFDANDVYINLVAFAGSGFYSGSIISVNVSFVPEPGTLSLMGIAVGATALTRFRAVRRSFALS
jgi:hypothetical protein